MPIAGCSSASGANAVPIRSAFEATLPAAPLPGADIPLWAQGRMARPILPTLPLALVQAENNLRDLCTEYLKYQECGSEECSEGEDDEVYED